MVRTRTVIDLWPCTRGALVLGSAFLLLALCGAVLAQDGEPPPGEPQQAQEPAPQAPPGAPEGAAVGEAVAPKAEPKPESDDAAKEGAQGQKEGKGEGESPEEGSNLGTIYAIVNEQILLLATLLGGLATIPSILEFIIERRKRRERLALSFEDVPVSSIEPDVAGMDELLKDIPDLIDRASDPQAYAGVGVGNEMLLIGGPRSGKRSLARRIAKEARMDRLVTVLNPRNQAALGTAKVMIQARHRKKVMLLIPRIDQVVEEDDEDLLAELDVLVETASRYPNVLVVGTAISCQPSSLLDNMFGIQLVLPGVRHSEAATTTHDPETRRVLTNIARHYLQRAKESGFRLANLAEDEFVADVLAKAKHGGDIADIVSVSRTIALYNQRKGLASELLISQEIIRKAVNRVCVEPVVGSESDAAGEAEQE